LVEEVGTEEVVGGGGGGGGSGDDPTATEELSHMSSISVVAVLHLVDRR
jgi:hypothetical protein